MRRLGRLIFLLALSPRRRLEDALKTPVLLIFIARILYLYLKLCYVMVCDNDLE
jgi:hypothetical protein